MDNEVLGTQDIHEDQGSSKQSQGQKSSESGFFRDGIESVESLHILSHLGHYKI